VVDGADGALYPEVMSYLSQSRGVTVAIDALRNIVKNLLLAGGKILYFSPKLYQMIYIAI